MGILVSMWVAVFLSLGGHLEFIMPADSVFAGRTQFKMGTDLKEDEVVGIELFINGQHAHYFDEAPYAAELDMKAYAQGPVLVRAVLETFNGDKFEAQFKGTNIAPDLEENVTLVRIPVLADKPSAGLSIKDFRLFEDGIQQEVKLMLGEEKPLFLLAVLDVSTSMEKRVVMLRHAMNALIERVRPGDVVQVIGFNHRVFEVSGPETDMEKVRDRLSLLEAKGDTNLYGALWSGLKTLGRSNERRALLLFTDGDHTVLEKDDLYHKNLEDCLELAKTQGVPIYTVGFGAKVNRKNLEALSETSGGKAFFKTAPKDLASAFDAIGGELRQQYLLCYYTKAGIGTHTIKVECSEAAIELKYPQSIYKSQE